MPSISRSAYDPLPRSDLDFPDLDDEESNEAGEFKDKPTSSTRLSSLLRKARRAFRSCRPLYVLIVFALLLVWQLLFNNSYASPQPFTIDTKEKVYIAANIVDEDLIGGAWGKSLRELVGLLGKERVFVSIYGSPKAALEELAQGLECEKSIVAEEDLPLDLDRIPRTTIPTTGEKKMKRIAYLAEVRNMALKPLQTSKEKWDKVMFINDVFFNPEDVLRLLWGTNVNPDTGRAEYKAACAADFVNSWKYYDTFATRDANGYSLGVPLYPWFTGAGDAISRRDVLASKDNVRVKSCWGGMVVFEGSYFQSTSLSSPPPTSAAPQPETNTTSTSSPLVPTLPLTFRSWQPEPYWDASECCLIHADIMASPSPSLSPRKDDPHDTGIYLNPFVRVSYSASVHKWLSFTRRFERLFYPIQELINFFGRMPWDNPRRLEVPGQVVADVHWVSNATPPPTARNLHLKSTRRRSSVVEEMGVEKRSNEKHTTIRPASYWLEEGRYEPFERTVQRGGYCAVRQLLVVKERSRGEGDTGGMWDKLIDEVPPLGS